MPCALREPTTTRPDPARSGRTGNHPEEKTMAMTGVLRPGHISLRVLDLDLTRLELTVRQGKGGKDRRTMLAQPMVEPLQLHLATVRQLHERELGLGQGRVLLPNVFARKSPKASTEWRWQFVFPAGQRSQDPRSGHVGRHHLHESGV